MVTEDYVSFETAKLLKEKGFDEECACFYSDYDYGVPGLEYDSSVTCINSWLDDEEYAAPTLQMTMKWLREVHNIDINIYAESLSHKKRYTISIWKNIQDDDAINDVILGVSTIYEEACETAIKYCLENLI